MKLIKARKIFIVDDDTMITSVLNDYLKAEVNHDITIFNTGEDCLEKLGDKPDIIVLDYELNTIVKDAANGLEILEIIKENHPEIHVIMLSSQERYGVAMKSMQKGAEQYVVKDHNAFEKVAELIRDLK